MHPEVDFYENHLKRRFDFLGLTPSVGGVNKCSVDGPLGTYVPAGWTREIPPGPDDEGGIGYIDPRSSCKAGTAPGGGGPISRGNSVPFMVSFRIGIG